MTETAEIPASTGGLDLAPGQITAMRDQWVSLGLDSAAFDQAAAGVEPTITADSGASEDGLDVQVLSPLKTPPLSAAQAQELASALIDAGVPRDQVDAALREDGFIQAAPDLRSDDEKVFDKAFGGVAPTSYRIDYMGRVPAGLDNAGLAEFNGQATAWLAAIGFPEQIGPAVVERAIDASQRLSRMSGPAKELWIREQWSDFERMAGSPERAAELQGFAAKALARAGTGFSDALWDAGALHDAGVLLHMAHQGERLAVRAS